MKDPRNHTAPVVEFIVCNAKFLGHSKHPLDLREFVVTPKLTAAEELYTPQGHTTFVPPDIRSALEYFYQALEVSVYLAR